MKFHYPNGKKYVEPERPSKKPGAKPKQVTYGNRGMTLEEDINETNLYYLAQGKAVIHKKPTPVQIVDVLYPSRSAAVIKEAYFKQPSTTDYNGVFKGRYIDFEAKETKNSTSFPLKNFHEHQITHMEEVYKHDGITFVLLRFSATEEVFLLPFPSLHTYWRRMLDGGRKSITKEEIERDGTRIRLGLHPRVDYLKIVQELYF
ncbi:Holliday junction resolvase RecU [Rossellomorea marisflavi]|uniref:Holliday junction resolvase RecU n=1 Tax=Rossellomorea marisflavi TaxID=189381 RepID=A0A5D4S307_9BACI|nr:Holliday junction resolvase RecU [Rossellomorea marisflavi]TYS56558.1 Holliday junction resolvase RecU [Rossellomorea marisflavi]UKS63811.1 Holliday junction resolvase RecU [Rossellomorea marisflavi]WJV20571.1 Holliday junction resolvase RecU [Rossellomorea marisflavi]